MKIELIKKEDLLRELKVEVPADRVNGIIEARLNEKKKDTTLKGYRKGKAPMDMIRSIYGEEIKVQVAEDIIKETYTEALKEKELKVASYPNVTALDFGDDGSLNYTASVEVFPEIDTVKYEGLEITQDKIEVNDEEVDGVIDTIRKRSADIREVERPVTDTDIVVVDIDKLEDPNNIIEQEKFENSEIDLSNPITIKEFKEQLPGMNKDESKEINVQYAEDYPDKAFAGQKLKYKVTVKTVKEQILPELNDAFAKQIGQVETLLELRIKIRENLNLQKEEDQKKDQKTQVIEHIRSKNEIQAPKALVEDYLNDVLENFKKEYKDQKFDEAEVRKNYEPLGNSVIQWSILMHQLAEQEKITVETEDIEKIINSYAENYQVTPDQARMYLQQSGHIANLRETILEDKVVDFVISKGNIKTADND